MIMFDLVWINFELWTLNFELWFLVKLFSTHNPILLTFKWHRITQIPLFLFHLSHPCSLNADLHLSDESDNEEVSIKSWVHMVLLNLKIRSKT